MHFKNLRFTICLGVLVTALLFISALSQDYDLFDAEKVRTEAEKLYLSRDEDIPVYRFYETTTIKTGEVIDGHVLVMEGDLCVRGRVNGDILVLKGDVEIASTGRVLGNVTAVSGTIDVHPAGKVAGNMIETNWKNLIGKNEVITRRFYKYYPHHYGTLVLTRADDRLAFRYNRVEGMFIGLEIPKKFRYPTEHLTGHGFLGYGFKSKAWRFQMGLDRWFFDPLDYRMEIGFEIHDLTDTKDLWRISYFENNLAALFLKQDFHDYFRRTGFSFHVSQNMTPYLQASLEFRRDDYESMAVRTNWSLFGGDKTFRSNPSLGRYEGVMRSIYGRVYIDSRDDVDFPTSGWFVKISGETASRKLGGDFSFNRYLLDVRRYQPISHSEALDVRVMIGTSDGDLPVQKDFELGGISTLRGYRYKEFAGTGMFLLNVEYKLYTSLFGGSLFWFDEEDSFPSLILFVDVGDVWNGSSGESSLQNLERLRYNRLKTDIGFAITPLSGHLRINFAKRVDRGDNDFVVTVRVRQPF